jgi:FkbM family methyltransferase
MSRVARELRDRRLALRLAWQGRVHQYPEIQALRRMVAAFGIDCIFDVGANAGQYATMLRKDVGFAGTILSFEPNPDVYAKLARRAAGDRKWHCFNLALSDSDGTATFNIMAADQFSSLEKPAEGLDPIFQPRNKVAQSVEVQTRRLETLYPQLQAEHGFAMPLLKMDTQGHDRSVCDGAGPVLGQMAGLQTELAVRPLYDGATGYREMIDWLAGQGFRPNAMFANNKGHFPLLVEMDGLFVAQRLVEDEGQ